jgi:hypothetical protein
VAASPAKGEGGGAMGRLTGVPLGGRELCPGMTPLRGGAWWRRCASGSALQTSYTGKGGMRRDEPRPAAAQCSTRLVVNWGMEERWRLDPALKRNGE